MRGEVLTTYNHPEGSYAGSRGNMEILQNGNVWTCWARGSLHSEHSPDGVLLMSARFRAALGSYRDYKAHWVGRPTRPPHVHSIAVGNQQKRDILVHVSWNGATEVVLWRLWCSDEEDGLLEVLAEAERRGFETAISTTNKFAECVVLEAVGRDGVSLGKSAVTKTIVSLDKQSHTATMNVANETVGMPDSTTSQTFQNATTGRLCSVKTMAMVISGLIILIAGIVGLGLLWFRSSRSWSSSSIKTILWRLQRKEQAYKPVPDGDNMLDAIQERSVSDALMRRSIDDDGG